MPGWYYSPASREGGRPKSRASGRPRNIGRALVAAGFRELQEEEREEKRAKEHNKGAAFLAALFDKTNAEHPTAPEPLPVQKASIGIKRSAASTQPQSRIANKKKYQYAYPLTTQPVPSYAKYVPVPYSGPTLLASAYNFSHFLTWFRVNASQMSWKIANNLTHNDNPKNLNKHISNSILVFSAKPLGRGSILIGASMFRKADISSEYYAHEGNALLEIAFRDGMILRRWTDWCPIAGDDVRMGIYVLMFRLMMVGNKDQVTVFEDSLAFERAQSKGKVDFRHEYALSLFETDQAWLK